MMYVAIVLTITLFAFLINMGCNFMFDTFIEAIEFEVKHPGELKKIMNAK